jgi:ABC-type branched-subunit amino acid transport system permease subunit
MGRLRQSTVPVKLLAIGGIAFLILAILPFVAGEFQANLMAKLLLFGVLGISLDLGLGLYRHFELCPRRFLHAGRLCDGVLPEAEPLCNCQQLWRHVA